MKIRETKGDVDENKYFTNPGYWGKGKVCLEEQD
jgi:hypothetical protein